MKRIVLLALVLLGLSSCAKTIEPVVHHHSRSTLHPSDPQYLTTYVEEYDSGEPEEDELEGVQCPIPMKDRVRNYTGIQCVFSSIEMLGRWAECKKLIDPPITSRSNCKSYSGPSDLAKKLNAIGVKFEQTTNKTDGLKLIKRAMAEGRGCLFSVPGHAMVLIHYDEETDTVKWVDNSDRSLRVQTMTVKRFHQRWDHWVCVIYAEKDLFPMKAIGNLAAQIPIKDRNNPQGEYPPDYFPLPRKD